MIHTRVNCIRRKLTIRKKRATRSLNLLKIIRAYISGLLNSTICGKKKIRYIFWWFFWHGYLYLIKEKFEALEKFKIFKTEVEKELEKGIKIVRSHPGGKYYGKYGVC